MGYGDEIMGTGIARGAARSGKRIAFGDGKRIIWNKYAYEIYRGNPNVAHPGSEGMADLEWIAHYPGNRLYHKGRNSDRFIFNPDFRAVPGEISFDAQEWAAADRVTPGFILIEPNVKASSGIAVNKRWPFERYQAVAEILLRDGYEVAQFSYGMLALEGVVQIEAGGFRIAASILQRSRLFIGPEGGLHHAAAMLRIPAVVIFGGFTHPRNTGYDGHENIFIGDEPCGSLKPCVHCRAAMNQISPSQVYESASGLLRGQNAETASRRVAAG